MSSPARLLGLIREKADHPATARELLQLLRVPREERATFKRHLKALVATGELVQTRGSRYGLPDRMNLVVGRVNTHPRGFGFVVPERPVDGLTGDIYIAGANLNQAMHGDRVVARIERDRDGARAEGRIVRILERSAPRLVGRYDVDDAGFGYVVPFDRRVIMDVEIPRGESLNARRGTMVTAEITRWPTPTRGPLGRVVEVLGDVDAPGVDTEIIIRKYGLPDEHSEEAVRDAKRLGTEVHERDLRGRTDFRPLVTVTIDGEHARDFDDAITISRLPDTHFWLGVHIADVSHYVREGTALDAEAYERGTSVYFPERAVHMFPAELSTGLCSLNPRVDRLVQSCLMEIDARGEVVRYELHDGLINSNARMTYTDVNAILEGEPDVRSRYRDLVATFELMRDLFHVLNGRRHRRGSIDFDLKEPEIILDDQGLVNEIIAAERNIAHRIIEEFMLLANETVAGHLDARDAPTLYRIHEPPDPLKVEEFEAFIGSFGHGLGVPAGTLEPRHFQQLVERIRGTAEEKPIAFLMLRSMQKARYDAQNLGHFGLAASTYTHFTSPIRRYPDLVVHRTLREARLPERDADRLEELQEDLPEIARHCSERERRADEAERELVQWKKVRFMTDKVGDEFEGYITGVTAFGLYVELVEHFVEGMVHVSTMADDYYRFVEKGHILRGENTQKVYRLGDRVNVQVVRVDLERRQIDLGLVEILETIRTQQQGRVGREGRAGAEKPAGRERRVGREGRVGRAVRAGRAGRRGRAGKIRRKGKKR
jgi:ribonuclease R